jgi:hypothetical protein
MIYVGIDPGKNGGVSGVVDDKLITFKCPNNVDAMAIKFHDLVYGHDVKLLIEKVHSFPGQGVVSTFSFGQNFGQWEGIIASLPIDYAYVQPKKWQNFFNIKEKEKKIRKLKLKQTAMDLYPDERITYAISDAILIMEYAKEHFSKNS